MQTIFRLPWCSDPLAPPKGQATDLPAVDRSLLGSKLKRKRLDSPEASASWLQVVKKQRAGDVGSGGAPAPPSAEIGTGGSATCGGAAKDDESASTPLRPTTMSQVDSPLEASNGKAAVHSLDVANLHVAKSEENMGTNDSVSDVPPASGAKAVDLTPLQHAIENEFNLQILTKHNELRLIEQELAKCQVALEQLRRCELRPFPGSDQLSSAMSSGSGPSLAPPPGYIPAPYAAPFGVADGPYTRHYRQWLLRGPQFEHSLPDTAPFVTSFPTDSRATRHVSMSRRPAQKSFSIPSTPLEAPQSQIVYPAPAPARKIKLAIVKRSTDGQLVKLVCNHCHRSDFSNSQGFLNHCRIAHKVEYKSHDHAAIDCGQLLDEQELASVPPEAHSTPVAKPAATRSASTMVSSAPTPLRTHSFVHPMNTAGSNVTFSASQTSSKKPPKPMKVEVRIPAKAESAPFTAASQAPHLSAQFAKYNIGGNLEEAIANAKQKVDMGGEDDRSPGETDAATPMTATPGAGRTPAPAGDLARPPSRKGYRQPVASRPRPPPLIQAPPWAGSVMKRDEAETTGSPQNFSPHSSDGNPGLVSDHEDDDHGSASEDEVPQGAIAHSLGVRPRTCSDPMDIDVVVEDDIDEHGVVIRRNSIGDDERGVRAAGSSSRKI